MLGGAVGLGERWAFRLLVGPVGFIVSAFFDPLLDDSGLLGSECISVLGWRHDLFWVRADDAQEGFASPGVAWNDGRHAFFILGGGSLKGIEPKAGFTILSIRPVAEETRVGEHRADVLVEADLIVRGKQGGG